MWFHRPVRFLTWLQPARTVPVTRWRAAQRWRPGPSTLLVLIAGLTLFGLGEALLVEGALGVTPWTVLAQGLSVRTGLAIGLTTFIVSCLVLLLWIPLRERPGPGTLLNILVISVVLEIGVTTIPMQTGPFGRLVFVLLGIALIGLASGFYLTCHVGPGPRDGWMTSLHHRTGWPVARVRFGIEAVVLVAGWLLGGTVGIGTVLFAVLIGPAVGLGLRIAGWVGRPSAGPVQAVDDEFPELDA